MNLEVEYQVAFLGPITGKIWVRANVGIICMEKIIGLYHMPWIAISKGNNTLEFSFLGFDNYNMAMGCK